MVRQFAACMRILEKQLDSRFYQRKAPEKKQRTEEEKACARKLAAERKAERQQIFEAKEKLRGIQKWLRHGDCDLQALASRHEE